MRRWISLISAVGLALAAWLGVGYAQAHHGDLAGHTDMVRDLAFSSDGATLASVSNDRSVRLWELRTGKILHQWSTDNYFVALSADGRLVAFGNGDGIDVVEIANGAVLHHFQMQSVTTAAFSPNGKNLATAGFGENDTIALWDLQSGTRLTTLKGNRNTVQSLVFSRDGARLLSSSSDNSVRVFAIPGGTQEASIRLRVGVGGVDQASFMPDEQTVVAGSWSSKLWIFDLRKSRTLHEIKTAPKGDHTSVAVSPDGTLIASATGTDPVKFWRPTGEAVAGTSPDATVGVDAIAFSPDGKSLAYAGQGDFAIHIRPVPEH